MNMKNVFIRKINFGIAAVALLISFNAAALECYSGNIVDEVEEIGKLVFLSGTQNGSRVWESKEYTRNITCSTKIKENVYFYPFPKLKTQPTPKGVEMGLIFNGKDLGTFNQNSGNGNISTKIDTGWNLNKTTATKTFKIKAYLKKTGEIDTSKVTGSIHLFQLDGEGGLNLGSTAKNYKFSLSHWNQTGTISCNSSFARTSFRIPVGTDPSRSGSSTFSVEPVLNIACTSETAGLAALLANITGDFALSGKAMTNAADQYQTDREHFGSTVSYKSTAVTQGKKISLTVPLNGGKASYPLPLVFTPRLSQLALNSPGWLFQEAEKEVKTTITPVFTPLSVNTN